MSLPPKPKPCFLCVNQIKNLAPVEVNILVRFISPASAKILPRKRSGLCALHQRKVANGIKRARIMALLPFVK